MGSCLRWFRSKKLPLLLCRNCLFPYVVRQNSLRELGRRTFLASALASFIFSIKGSKKEKRFLPSSSDSLEPYILQLYHATVETVKSFRWSPSNDRTTLIALTKNLRSNKPSRNSPPISVPIIDPSILLIYFRHKTKTVRWNVQKLRESDELIRLSPVNSLIALRELESSIVESTSVSRFTGPVRRSLHGSTLVSHSTGATHHASIAYSARNTA